MSVNETITTAEDVFGQFTFGWIDYVLFSMLLLVSLLIGIYFGFFSKQDSTAEYLMGGKRMGFFPVAMSMIASHVSGITLLGVPAEVYQHGSQYAACVFTSALTALATAYIYLPVFYKLQLNSTFEYLELRFGRSVRKLCSILFIISSFSYMPIVVYVPALAFSQVANLNLHILTPILCVVCIIYTSIGGLKAVVWTDTIQFSVTIFGLFAVLFLGLNTVDGFANVFRISDQGGRLVFFNMDPSPFVRVNFWGMIIGMTVTWLGHMGINQGSVQRFLSVPKEKDARKATAVTAVGLIVVKLVAVFTGLIMFAKYHDCDPVLSKAVKRSDQMLPFYVMDVAGNIPGLPGLFLAGLVSAALATMSATLNTVSGTIYEDFIEPWIPEGPTKEARSANIMKVIVVITGAITVGLVFVVEHLGTIFQVAVSTRSLTDGPLLGLFTLGMVVPWANLKGALLGGYASLATMLWLIGGTQWHIANKRIIHSTLPMSIAGCPYPLNDTAMYPLTTEHPPLHPEDEPMFLFKISFLHYSSIGLAVAVVVGVIGSFVFGKVDLEEVDPDHITPIMKRFLPPRKYGQVLMTEIKEPSGDVDKEKEVNGTVGKVDINRLNNDVS